MRFLHVLVILSVLSAAVGFGATTAAKSTAKKKSPSVAAKKGAKSTARAAAKAPAKSAVKSGAKGKAVKGKSTKAPASTWRTRQLNPTQDRYREIQQALVDKGYLKAEPTGVWDADSISALQRFQSDQKLTANGKITAPALIALGLGGKSAGAPEAAPLTPPSQ